MCGSKFKFGFLLFQRQASLMLQRTSPVAKGKHAHALCLETALSQDQMVNRGSTAAAEELEGLSKRELLSMLKFGADR